MKLIAFLAFCILLCFSCGTQKQSVPSNYNTTTSAVSDASTDGSSYEKAIVINEKSERKGIDAEYRWLEENYPGYILLMQSLRDYKNKPYDVLKIRTKEGEEKEIFFGISKFFGKF